MHGSKGRVQRSFAAQPFELEVGVGEGDVVETGVGEGDVVVETGVGGGDVVVERGVG